jgi:ADP-heptose:LPS heptosyltransferase
MTTVMALQRRRRTAPAERAGAPALDGPIERIVVFRALMLGDLLCAVPALRALRRGFAQASITLVGLPWAAALVERLACVDRFIEFPGHPALPEKPCDVRALPVFLAKVQSQRFDLALQLHGSGPVVNPLVATFGARHSAGFFDAASWRPENDAACYAPWPERGHEIERMLALTDWLGLPRDGTQLDFPLQAADREALAGLWPGGRRPPGYVCVHAGAQLPSRRWPVERFAEVANRLAAAGRTVVLTGTVQEAELIAALSAAIEYPVINLAGRTSLWTLGALIEGAEALVCNDTGVSHVAAALGTPSVVVSAGSDVERWAPLDRARHRVLWQPMSCRPCSHAICPIDNACARAIEVAEVMQALDALAAQRGHPSASRHAARGAAGAASPAGHADHEDDARDAGDADDVRDAGNARDSGDATPAAGAGGRTLLRASQPARRPPAERAGSA